MTLTLFIGLWLAAYRLTRLITKDSIFDRPRFWFLKRYPSTGAEAKLAGKDKISPWGTLITCPFCMGWWISGLVVLIVANWHSMSMPVPVLWWFATSSAVGLTAKSLD